VEFRIDARYVAIARRNLYLGGSGDIITTINLTHQNHCLWPAVHAVPERESVCLAVALRLSRVRHGGMAR
jgi:hypothetical protein